ncbi:DUF2391 domain-containing protein [Natranaeroarchaeum sulfidigenes]|uniref:Putative membrane protein n=1 Tax=Natranaeroarchaeum sulfidigenes TaxID=2784880 RepID=A0A897MM85_9EURY|nr:DUF2391 domain-containing protein [Natranaeroarchaeum sulfidigenes]QSG03310.1 putative membrane protein [Natranaeroarchaeum sulfidigenes]
MSSEGRDSGQSPADYDIGDVLRQLDELEGTVDSSKERQEVRRTRRMLESVPGSDRIRKYTSRDIAEGFVGGIIFSLPLLVEDGVFEIAEWFVEFTVASIPVFFVINVLFIVGLVSGLLYFTDIRNVQVRLLFGFLPKRLAAVLLISLFVAAGTMLMWGRLTAEGPSNFEMLARITVIWAAAALGASLGDILPGESSGTDIADRVAEIGDR